jgi:hypothetical protein
MSAKHGTSKKNGTQWINKEKVSAYMKTKR